MSTTQGTLILGWDTSEGSLALVVYEVTWPDNEPGFLFMDKVDAVKCAESERKEAGYTGTVVNRYVF